MSSSLLVVRPWVRHGRHHRGDRTDAWRDQLVELPAEDTAKAREFYGTLFGWRTSEFDGDYHVIDSGVAGAIAPKNAERPQPRIYFATDDIEVSVKLVRELGGTADDVVPVPGIGKIAHCRDNQLMPFSLYEPARQA